MTSEKHVTHAYPSCTNSYIILIRKYEVKIALERVREVMRIILETVLKEQNMFVGLNLSKGIIVRLFLIR